MALSGQRGKSPIEADNTTAPPRRCEFHCILLLLCEARYFADNALTPIRYPAGGRPREYGRVLLPGLLPGNSSGFIPGTASFRHHPEVSMRRGGVAPLTALKRRGSGVWVWVAWGGVPGRQESRGYSQRGIDFTWPTSHAHTTQPTHTPPPPHSRIPKA